MCYKLKLENWREFVEIFPEVEKIVSIGICELDDWSGDEFDIEPMENVSDRTLIDFVIHVEYFAEHANRTSREKFRRILDDVFSAIEFEKEAYEQFWEFA